jgi:poly-gamma-glutamate synthesis protein (capsule biosynthesis protein)
MTHWLLRGFIVGLLFLNLSLFAGAQTACSAAFGSVSRATYASAWLGQTMYYSVYLPPCYENTSDVYPVVYLMHGSNEDDGAWQRLGMIAALDAAITDGTLPPMILVMPFGNVIANRNRFDDVSWGNIFLTELMPAAENNYRIDARPERRVIAGVSRGGFWAYQIGLRRPDLFSAIAGHSPFFDLYHAEPADNPLHLILDAPNIENMRFWMDRGKDDYAAPGIDIMADRMIQRGIPHTYTIHPQGEHNNFYWAQHVTSYLQFYAAVWQAATQATIAPTLPNTGTSTPAPFSGFATNTPQNVETTLPDISITPTPTPAPTGAANQGISLYVPVVAFPSLLTTLNRDQINALAAGQLDSQLVITPEVAAALPMLHPQTRQIAPEELRNILWRDRTLYALIPFQQLSTQLRVLWLDDAPIFNQLANYPFALSSPTPNFDPTQLTRITFSGVTALARQTRVALDTYGIDYAASGIQEYVTHNDFFHISNEVSFYPTCPVTTGDLFGGSSSFCSKPEHFELLKQLDVDIVELSGNHNNDYGYQAYRDTLNFYRDNQMATVGGGETVAQAQQPLILEHNGNTLALIACNVPGPYYALVNEDASLLGGIRPGTTACDWAWLDQLLPELSAQVDTVIVTVQHQEYEEYTPTQSQQFDFRRLAEAGADVVLGTAAHKPQTYEFYPTQRGATALLHYGMGNLFFDQPFWGNMRFFMNTLYIYAGQIRTIEVFPGIIEASVRPRLMTPDERLNFLFFMFVEQNKF